MGSLQMLRCRLWLLLAVVGVALCLAPQPSYADKYWVGHSGNWDFPGNWSTTYGGPPGAPQPQQDDNVFLTAGDGISRFVYYLNTLYPNDTLNRLRIDATNSGTMTLVQQYADPLYAQFEDIGFMGTGSFQQSNGSNKVSNALTLGVYSGSSGTYELSGSGNLSAPLQNIGEYGTGTFTQSGGANTSTRSYIGINSGSSGTYTQSAGTNTVSYDTNYPFDSASLFLGYNTGASGEYILSDTGSLQTRKQYIGYYGMGNFTQSGGTNSTSSLILGFKSGGNGTYNLSGGNLYTAVAQAIGVDGTGTFIQSGGGNSVTSLNLGYNAGNCTYELSGGSLTVHQGLSVNNSGSTFAQSGGSVTIADSLFLSNFGTYHLRGSGTLSAVYQLINSFGVFIQAGGTNEARTLLSVGNNIGSTGTYDLNNGDLSAYLLYLGYYGSGTLNQQGGTNTITNNLNLGEYGSGIYNLQGGTLTVENINLFAGGTFKQTGGELNFNSVNQTGGSAILTDLWLGKNFGSNITYNLSNGSLSAPYQYIGLYGNGAFTHSGGTNTADGDIFVGYSGPIYGDYNLSGSGSISASREYIGFGANGTFTQNGGTNSVSDSLTIANYPGSSGIYNLQGGILSTGNIYVNTGGNFNVTGVASKLITTVTGDVTNAGTMKTTNADVTWNGSFTITEGGVYISNDPSTQTFKDLTVEAQGCVMAASQDTFVIKNNFQNKSTRSEEWETGGAVLQFVRGDDEIHDVTIPGADIGPTPVGYENNYAWGKLILGELDQEGNIKPGTEQTMHFHDGNGTPGGALYVGEIKGLLFDNDLITNIYGHDNLNIYYDSSLPVNAYLGGQSYALMLEGNLVPAPVPAIAQVTNNSGYDIFPQVNKDGCLVWQGWDGHDYEIYKQIPGQNPIQLTSNDTADAKPQMNAAGHEVWQNWDSQDWEIWCDLGSGPVQLTNNTFYDVLPQISADNLIYWQSYDGSDYEICQYNPATQTTTQLTSNGVADVWPQVNQSGQLTWMEWDGGNWQVWYDPGSGPAQLTTSGSNQKPRISDDGLIVWQQYDGQDFELCSYNIGTKATAQLTNNTVDDVTPSVQNGVLVWSQWDGSYWQIFREILSTGIITQITNNSNNKKNPQVNASGQIVWQKWDGQDYEIYVYK